MGTKKEKSEYSDLRQRAEKELGLEENTAEELLEMSPEAMAKLIHELQVHRVELKMQNHELRCLHEELEKARDTYSHLYDFAPIGYFTLSEKGLIVEANLTFATMLGHDRGNLIKKPLSSFVLKEDEDILYKHRQQLLETEMLQSCELRLVNSEGHCFFARLECIVIKTKAEDSRQIRVTVSDITEYKQTEEALRASEEMMRSSQSVAHICSYSTNLNVNEIEKSSWVCSPEFYNIFGIDETYPHTIAGWTNFIHPDYREEVFDYHESVVKERKPFSREYKIIRINDGAERWVHGTGELEFDEKGNPFRMHGAIQDITERRRSAAEKEKLHSQLIQAQKMESIGNLAGGIAHEFNNMLAIIMGNNELIIEELPQGSLARESNEEIRIAGLRARDVVKQLLTFSRQDNTVKKVMDLKCVVEESMTLIRSTTPANIKIEQNILADTYPVMGNATQINQILINLCNNAIDALPEMGGILNIALLNETIDIQQTKHQTKLNPGQYAKLMVSDNGIGMETVILDRVFEPYFTTKNIGEGTGIGMAVVHGIVERHGGAIAVDSKPGQGTTFTIFFPAHEGLFEQETDKPDILPGGDECILYVDDEPSLATLGKRLLERFGYTAVSITDPVKALDMIRADPNKFDLLITDMAMPNMTGEQLVIETLEIRQDMPIIICTGYSAKISEKEAADIGVRSYLMKPINKSELAKMVRKVLDEAKRSNQGKL